MIGHIETFQDVQALTHVMGTVGYSMSFESGKGYVLKDSDGNYKTNGHYKYLDFLAVCKTLYDEAKLKEKS